MASPTVADALVSERPAPLKTSPETRRDILPQAPAPYTLDEATPLAPYLEAMPSSDTPKAQQALTKFLKKIFPEQPH